VIGLVFTGFFAFGLVLISKTPSTVDLTHILFGNVLGISNQDIIHGAHRGDYAGYDPGVRKDCFSVLTQPCPLDWFEYRCALLYPAISAFLNDCAHHRLWIILVVAMLVTPRPPIC